jgi:hypothetical protein
MTRIVLFISFQMAAYTDVRNYNVEEKNCAKTEGSNLFSYLN